MMMVVMMEMTYIYWASASIWKSCAAMASWSLSWRAYWNTTEHLYWTWNNVLIPIDFSTMLVLCAYIQYINIFKKTYILFSMYKIKFITILSYHLYRSTKYRTITNTPPKSERNNQADLHGNFLHCCQGFQLSAALPGLIPCSCWGGGNMKSHEHADW